MAQNKLIKVPGSNFSIQEHEVTIAEFIAFIKATKYKTSAEKSGGAGAYKRNSGTPPTVTKGVNYLKDLYGETIPPGSYASLPVVHISYNDANAYCKWLGKKYEVPTLSQWLLAAADGMKVPKFTYAGSNNAKSVGWFDDNSYQTIKAIKTKNPNKIGAYDLCGNVAEITKPDTNWKWPTKYIGVGGSYFNGADMMDLKRYAIGKNSGWLFNAPSSTYPYMGFRCICMD